MRYVCLVTALAALQIGESAYGMLVIYSWDDHSVSAESAAAFAKYARADTLAIASPCGHLATSCEGARITPVVREFLAR